jgi:hypothetical protein
LIQIRLHTGDDCFDLSKDVLRGNRLQRGQAGEERGGQEEIRAFHSWNLFGVAAGTVLKIHGLCGFHGF